MARSKTNGATATAAVAGTVNPLAEQIAQVQAAAQAQYDAALAQVTAANAAVETAAAAMTSVGLQIPGAAPTVTTPHRGRPKGSKNVAKSAKAAKSGTGKRGRPVGSVSGTSLLAAVTKALGHKTKGLSVPDIQAAVQAAPINYVSNSGSPEQFRAVLNQAINRGLKLKSLTRVSRGVYANVA